MPTDVSGTINIIAEVVGRNQTATNDANDVLEGKNKQAKNKNIRFRQMSAVRRARLFLMA